MNILDYTIWTTPLSRYVVIDCSYATGAVLAHAGIDADALYKSALYEQIVEGLHYGQSLQNLLFTEQYADKLFSELETAGVIIRLMGKEMKPRFHEEQWQRTNNLKRRK